tara:strand:- start:37 stop:1878 length:1842 start_codon:yes stop_codon:yes gene_type:complete
MATNITTTQLDFNNIKTSLKTFLAAKPEFKDYNFEGSGLSNILDVLAYNTHYNGLLANFALNESFLNTAQLRSSIVSHAQTLGYAPRSATSAAAILNISVNLAGVAGRPATITLDEGRTFTSSIAGTTYTFRTLKDHFATDDGTGNYVFKETDGTDGIFIFEGEEKTKTFFVGEASERQIYVIPDQTIDTSTAKVLVYPDVASTTFDTYLDINKAIRVTSTSQFYQLVESPNGNYELNFGDGVSIGKAPAAGSVVKVSYLSTLGSAGNAGSTFTPSANIQVNGVEYTFTIVTQSNSAGGAARQTIESIKQNAPIAFSSQQRLVTAEDYRALILSNYSAVTDVIAWGGEDNVPTNYGNVYVALKFADGTSESQKQTIKDGIVANLTTSLSIMSIGTVFVDPIETFLEIICGFDFDPSKTSLTRATTEARVFTEIINYFTNTLDKFGSTFRRSNLLTNIDALGDFVISSRIDVKMQQRLVPTVATEVSYDIQYPEEIAAPNAATHTITSGPFRFNNDVCRFRNKLGTTTIEIINISTDVPQVDNAGTYFPGAGRISLVGFNPEALISGTDFIKVTADPLNQATVKPLRNFVLKIDTDASFAQGTIDTQTTEVALT